ncbi:hypothetical protein AB4Z01_18215 [Inquilinus sp. YAF38]|uniref:hypothetical protein n=1 Tax=Inquilinus sp. YAF38 TaxID=3233084 RepID=UPI003F8F3699
MATIIGTNGNDSLFGTSGDDQIFGLGGNDILSGGTGANDLFGGAGDDILGNDGGGLLEGGAGADVMHGGRYSIDHLSYAGSSAGVTVNLTTRVASGGDAQGDKYDIYFDGVVGSAFDDVLTGASNVSNSLLTGGAGHDILTLGLGGGRMQGGAGADTLIGAPGGGYYGSTVLYTDSPSGVTVNLTAGTGIGGDAEGDVLQSIEAVFASAYDDVLIGGSQGEALNGVAGDDVLRGGGGADSLSGGAGDDLLVGGTGADTLSGSDGVDTVDYSLAAARVAVDLVTGGTAGEAAGDTYVQIENALGSGFNDSMRGDAGANQLEGGAGADVLDGRAGVDTASYEHSAAGVTVGLASGMGAGGDAEGDALTGFESLRGSGFADTLGGDSGSNTLEGGAGADALYGGAGIDTASYAHSAAGVQVDLVAGIGTGGDAAGDSFISIENLIGSDHNDVLKGGSGSSALSGGAGDDILEGSAAADDFDGGAGFDRVLYTASSAGVMVDLQVGLGLAGDALDDLLINIEGLTGSNLADRLTGSGTDNIFYGIAGNDILAGGAGADTLSGGAGADQLDGGSGLDTASYYIGSAGVAVDLAAGTASGGDAAGDTLTGIENLTGSNQGDDILVGTGGANVLQGWAGNDVLTGAGGKDALTGGTGADRFVYLDAADSAVGAGADRIADFSRGQGDKVDLSAIDADTGAAGHQAFSFIGSALYSGVAGQLRYAVAGGVTTIAGDVNGDGVSDFHIQLNGAIGLVAGDFVL